MTHSPFSIIVSTLTGPVDLWNPDPSTITLRAMSHHLAKLDRWAGALALPFSIAQHSILVMEIFRIKNPTLSNAGAIHALTHDAEEYLFGDWIVPAVQLLAADLPGFRQHLSNHKNRLRSAIWSAFDIEQPSMEILAAIHEADQIAAATEWRNLMPTANGSCPIAAPPARIMVKPLAWPDAAAAFTNAFKCELFTRNANTVAAQ